MLFATGTPSPLFASFVTGVTVVVRLRDAPLSLFLLSFQ
jgi:hypothetical protein